MLGFATPPAQHPTPNTRAESALGSATCYVLLDITGVPVVDSHVAQGLLNIVHAARLLGAEVALVGVRPEVAQTIVALGLDLRGMPTHQSLQDGIAYTLRREHHSTRADRAS